MSKLVAGLRSFILLCVVMLAFSAFEEADSAPAGAKSKTSVVSVSDPTFQSCKFHREPALEPILANQNLCILVGKQTSNLKGDVYVYLIGPSTIDERNAWINEVGKWLKTKGLDACGEKTMYGVTPYGSTNVKPPLANQVAGIPGEKAFYGLGGLASPSFCPQPCPGGNRLDHLGRCSNARIALPERGLPAELPKIEKAALKRDFIASDQRYNYLFDFDFVNALAKPIEIISVNVFDVRGQKVEQDWAISGPNADPRLLTHELTGNHPLIKIFSKPGRGTPLEQATVSSAGGRMEIKITNRILSTGQAIRPSGHILASKNNYDSLILRVAYRVNGNLQEVSHTFTVGVREEEKPPSAPVPQPVPPPTQPPSTAGGPVGEACVFRHDNAPILIEVGHVGWGWKIAGSNPERWVFGSTDAKPRAAYIPPGEDNGVWVKEGNRNAMMKTFRHLGYKEFKCEATKTSAVKAAYQSIEQVKKAGYDFIGVWQGLQGKPGNNCMDHTVKILTAYGARDMPNPTFVETPDLFFWLIGEPWQHGNL